MKGDKARRRKMRRRMVNARKGSLCVDFETYFRQHQHPQSTNKYAGGPYQIVYVTVVRKRQGEMVEVKKRCIVGASLVPLVYGPRDWLDKQLKKYELGFAKYLMTKDTKAEGI